MPQTADMAVRIPIAMIALVSTIAMMMIAPLVMIEMITTSTGGHHA